MRLYCDVFVTFFKSQQYTVSEELICRCDKRSNGRTHKVLTVVDEDTREELCVEVRPKINAHNVLNALHPLLKTR